MIVVVPTHARNLVQANSISLTVGCFRSEMQQGKYFAQTA